VPGLIRGAKISGAPAVDAVPVPASDTHVPVLTGQEGKLDLVYFRFDYALDHRDMQGNFWSAAGGGAISMRPAHFLRDSLILHTKPARRHENGLTARGSGRWRADDAAESRRPTSTGAAGLLTRAAVGGGAGRDAARWQGARGAAVLEYGLGTPRRSANEGVNSRLFCF
jgi:hypothetical protein